VIFTAKKDEKYSSIFAKNMITAKGVKKKFGELAVLKGVDLEIQAAEVVSIVGSSGAGKTTLLQLLGTLDQADAGSIQYDGKEVANLSSNALAEFRNRNIGFVFQFHHLLAEFSALENVAMPALIAGESMKLAENKAKKWLDRLGLLHRLDHKPSALSGGEQQRVATARALINQPKVIFADEPSGNLDSTNADKLHQLFFELREEFNQTFVIVTHNLDLAKSCDRTLKMKDGLII
jgi:lipoprotein-releasing system ATP-binding protein